MYVELPKVSLEDAWLVLFMQLGYTQFMAPQK
jgi:hypothetical protein